MTAVLARSAGMAVLLAVIAALLIAALPPPPGPVAVAAEPASEPAPVRHSGVLRDPGRFDEILPPDHYQGDGVAIVVFANRQRIIELCGKPNAEGLGPIACAGSVRGKPTIAVPNPCLAAHRELYAAILCHELGHVNGWTGGHGG